MRLDDFSDRLECKFGQEVLKALLNSKYNNKPLLYLPYNYQVKICAKNTPGGGQYTQTYKIDKHHIKEFFQYFKTQKLQLTSYEKRRLSIILRITKILSRIDGNIKRRIIDEFKTLKRFKKRVTNANDIAKIYGIKNALIYNIGIVIRERRKLMPGIDAAIAEVQRMIKARILQNMLNGIIYGYIDELHTLGEVDLDIISYNRIDVKEAQSCHKINLLNATSISLDFIENNIDSILEWLSSTTCKEKYIQTNHPYIPLLDPSSFDYKNIESIIAWDLNMPLKNNYAFVVMTRGAQGHAALSVFLNTIFSVKYVIRPDPDRDNGELDNSYSYRVWYKGLLDENSEKQNVLLLANITEEIGDNSKKLAYLCWYDKEILCLVRDPISRIKTSVNHLGESKRISNFNLNDDYHEIVKTWMYYCNGTYGKDADKPDLTNIRSEGILQPVYLYIDSYFYKPHDNITYIDMSEIQGRATIQTMQNIANRFNATMPDNHDVYLNESGGILGYMLTGDEKILHINSNIRLYLLHINTGRIKDLEIVDDILDKPKELRNMILAMEKQHKQDLINDNALFNKTKQSVQELMQAIKQRIYIENMKKFNDEEIIDFMYMQDNYHIIKDFLEKEMANIKSKRPDIVASWKSYQAFLKKCNTDNR